MVGLTCDPNWRPSASDAELGEPEVADTAPVPPKGNWFTRLFIKEHRKDLRRYKADLSKIKHLGGVPHAIHKRLEDGTLHGRWRRENTFSIYGRRDVYIDVRYDPGEGVEIEVDGMKYRWGERDYSCDYWVCEVYRFCRLKHREEKGVAEQKLKDTILYGDNGQDD